MAIVIAIGSPIPTTLVVGTKFQVPITVTNTGSYKLTSVIATVNATPYAKPLGGTPPQPQNQITDSLPDMAAGSSQQFQVEMQATQRTPHPNPNIGKGDGPGSGIFIPPAVIEVAVVGHYTLPPTVTTVDGSQGAPISIA